MLSKQFLPSVRNLSNRLFFQRLEKPILIYQMGKIGSSTISRALQALGYSSGHCASPEDNCNYDIIHTHSHEFVARYLQTRRSDRDQIIITGFRDLLRRNISVFFQNFDNNANRWWFLGTRDEIEHAQTNYLINLFNSRHHAHFHNLVEPWFDNFRAATGVDIYSHPFSTERGWLEIETPGKRFVYRTEDLQICEQPLASFLRKLALSVGKANVGAEKWYSAQYRMFMAKYKPNQETLGKIYESQIMQHFYSSAERASFITSWKWHPRNSR